MGDTAPDKGHVSPVTTTPQDATRVLNDAECLYAASEVEQALDSLAASITRELGDQDPLLLVVMTGGFIFAGQLLTRLDFPLQVDYLHATRYHSGTIGHDVQWRARPKLSLQGRHVLVLDDILDEGHTLAAVLEDCRQAGAATVRCAVLVEKHHERKFGGIHADFVGLDVEDKYVFGYGLDYHEYLRNVPGIYAVREPE